MGLLAPGALEAAMPIQWTTALDWLARWVREHQRRDLEVAAHARETEPEDPAEAAP
jgi:hypothetical protein